MATITNVQDPSSLFYLAVDSNGRIGINNFPTLQTIAGTVNIQEFPAVQTVNGTIDVIDRPMRQLGQVQVLSGGYGTNTAPEYTILQDASNNTHLLKINADGSINVDMQASSLVIGDVVIQAVSGVALAADQSNSELRVSLYGKHNTAGDTALAVDASGNVGVNVIGALPAGLALIGGVELVDSSGTNKASIGATGAVLANLAVGTALAAYGSNPSETASAGADTQYKFGSGGTTSFNHCVIQNNTSISIFYAFDQDTTTAGHEVYVLAAGQTAAWDRSGTVLHFSSASQQNFGGQTGITVEAFA